MKMDELPARLYGGNTSGSLAITLTMAAFIAIALYNALELLFLILHTFNRYTGLYFWSIFLSNTLGVIPASIGSILDYYNIGPLWLILTISQIGFSFLVPGQSIVLYSRLHLVSHNYAALIWIRNIIWLDSIALIIVVTILYFGAAYFPPTTPWEEGFKTLERIQVTWFCVQEILISTFYIYETIKIIKYRPETDSKRMRLLYELLGINACAILMDIALLALEYTGLYFVQVIVKSTVYSVKLKLEFAVLGRLISMVQITRPEGVNAQVSSFSGGVRSDVSYATPNSERPLYSRDF